MFTIRVFCWHSDVTRLLEHVCLDVLLPVVARHYMHTCGETRNLLNAFSAPVPYLQALLGMFNDSQSFYFCLNSDLTQSLQRRLDSPEEHQQLPLWERVSLSFLI